MNIDWILFKNCFPLALAHCENGGRNTAVLAAMGTISGTHRYMEKDLLEMGIKGYTLYLYVDTLGMLDMLVEIRSI